MNPKRVIFTSMLLAGIATSLNMGAQKGRFQRPDYWRIWMGASVATFLALVLDAFGAGEVVAPITMTAAVAAILGGHEAADGIVRILGGTSATGRAPVAPGSPTTAGAGATTVPEFVPASATQTYPNIGVPV